MQIKNSVQSWVRKIFFPLAFLLFLLIGFGTMSVVTSCKAEAGLCGCALCTKAGSKGVGGTFIKIYNTIIQPALTTAQSQITTYMKVYSQSFRDVIKSEIADTEGKLTRWFDTFWFYNLLPAMQEMTDQLTVMGDNQALMLASMQDAMNMNRLKMQMETEEVNDLRALRPGDGLCVGGTIVGGMTRAYVFRQAYNSAASAERLPRTANQKGTPAAAGTGADIKDRFDNYVSRYCRKDDNGGAAGCADDAAFADQDIDVQGTVFNPVTIDLKNPDVKKSVDDLIVNIAEPLAKDPVAPKALGGGDGNAAILQSESYKAKRQVIYDGLYHVVARRAPGSGLKEYVAAIREEAGIDPSLFSENPSHHEIMHVMMSERFLTGKYGTTQMQDPENNQRELVMQQAFQMMQMADHLDLMDRYALILSAQVSDEIRAAKPVGNAAEATTLK